ncbi:MAG: glycosyltransferase family 2 protein [Planctomycetota bacterium]
MSFWLLWITLISIVLLGLMQTAFVVWYLRGLRDPSQPIQPVDPDDAMPAVAVVLCLRGSDPSLVNCLRSLMQMDYPNFQLHLAFDDHDDPAVAVCRHQLKDRKNVVFHVNLDHGRDRSLKCSSIIATVLELDEEIEVVALVDADAVVQPDWLTRLVAPLRVTEVGASTGNRWFAPTAGGLGSTLRKVWNAAALPQMYSYNIAWGGSLAIRRDVIEKCELLDRWSTAFCEDTMLTQRLKEHGLQVVRVPELIVVNQESTTIRDALNWIRRQLLTVRLYHGGWKLVLAHAVFGGLCLFGPPLVALYFLIQFQLLKFIWVVIFAVMSQLFSFVLMLLIELANRRVIVARYENLEADRGSTETSPEEIEAHDLGPLVATPMGLVAFAMLQLLYPFLALGAASQQLVRWRGISYRILDRSRIEMIEYRPFAETLDPESTGTDRSIH